MNLLSPFDRPKLATADAIAIFSRIDHAVIECIWMLEQADLTRKRQIAKEHAHENIKFVRSEIFEGSCGAVARHASRKSTIYRSGGESW
jgi:hypothetical protein